MATVTIGEDAQDLLGVFYLRGIGRPRDISRAVDWLTKAGENGVTNSQTLLGEIFYGSKKMKILLPPNLHKSFFWFDKAAHSGSQEAQIWLAAMYADGLGTVQSYENCYVWANIASMNGNKNAVKIRQACSEKLTKEAVLRAQSKAARYSEEIFEKDKL